MRPWRKHPAATTPVSHPYHPVAATSLPEPSKRDTFTTLWQQRPATPYQRDATAILQKNRPAKARPTET